MENHGKIGQSDSWKGQEMKSAPEFSVLVWKLDPSPVALQHFAARVATSGQEMPHEVWRGR